MDGCGRALTTGRFTATADFDPGADTFNLTSAGNNDIFVSKLGPPPDSDGDGVPDADDLCSGTTIPESVPSLDLQNNRWALLSGDCNFDMTTAGGGEPDRANTTSDTAGCSCEQIIVQLHLGSSHTKVGCSTGVMERWVSFVTTQ